MANNTHFKILSIDGGGVFGCIPVSFMGFVDNFPKDKFDAFGGTSVGAQLVSAYAEGMSTAQLSGLFPVLARQIFEPRPWYGRLNPFGPRFSDINLNMALRGMLKSDTLGQIKPGLVIPVFDFGNNKPKVYDNMADGPDRDMPVWEICRQSCAAPTYFAPWKGGIDGGIIANNPVVVTAMAVKSKLGIPFEQMKILSIGTGRTTWKPVDIEAIKKWNGLKWLRPMLDVLIEGNELTADFTARQLPLASYVRWNPLTLDEGMEMDSPDTIEQCIHKCDIFKQEFIDLYNNF